GAGGGGEERGEKIKGQLMAADEKTGEADILFHIVREHGAGLARASRLNSPFIRLREYPISCLLLSRRFVQNHELALQLEDLTMHCGKFSGAKSPCEAVVRFKPTGTVLERAFVIIGLHRTPPAWRYRLGVRTEDSQSSNPGSIPG